MDISVIYIGLDFGSPGQTYMHKEGLSQYVIQWSNWKQYFQII
jgi:hypothetical protein